MSEMLQNIQTLKFRAFVAGFRAESISLWLLCFYILEEYIRPQSMYPAIDILPWGQVAILACFFSVFLSRSKALGFGAMDKLFVLMTFIVILSGIMAWDPHLSLKYWAVFTSWVLLYFCVVSILNTPQRMLLFALFFLVINFKMSQHGARMFALRGFSFASYGLAGAPGWFSNSGEFTLEMVVIFSLSTSILLAFRDKVQKRIRWWILLFLFPGTALLTVVGASSRGGQFALLAVLLIFMLRGKHFFRKVIIICVLAFLAMHLMPEQQRERFTTMGDDKTSELRLEHWKDAMDVIKHNPLGIGYQNWIPYYEKYYHPVALEQIHNTILQAFVDLGYQGGILFIVMLLTAFVMNYRTCRQLRFIDSAEAKTVSAIAFGVSLGLLGTLIAALFMSVLYYPMFWLAFAMTSSLRHMAKTKLLIEQKVSIEYKNGRQMNSVNTIVN